MKAVIQAGGKGTRLRDITKDEIPKPMVPILGKPLLEWQIEKCKENGITEIILIIGHLGNCIREYFGEGTAWNVSVSYVEEREPLGTAGAFFDLKDMIGNEDFLMVYGDVFWDIDVSRMLRYHCEKHSLCTLFVHPNTHPFDSDLILQDESGRITGIDSKHNVRDYWYDNLVNAGLYVINGQVCERVIKSEKVDLEKQIFRKMIEEGEAIYGYRSPEYIKDAGTVERLLTVEEEVRSGYTASRNLQREQKCIFLDRDGTVNVKNGLVDTEDKLMLEHCAAKAIKRINQSGYLAILVTNQPVVAKGMCTMEEVRNIHRKLTTLLGEEGAFLDDIAFCPHHPDIGFPGERPEYKFDCECRKPKTGLLMGFVEQYHINLAESWMIGDTTRDTLTGNNAGTHTALVLTGDAGKDGKYQAQIDLTCCDLLEAVECILNNNGKQQNISEEWRA